MDTPSSWSLIERLDCGGVGVVVPKLLAFAYLPMMYHLKQ